MRNPCPMCNSDDVGLIKSTRKDIEPDFLCHKCGQIFKKEVDKDKCQRERDHQF